MFLALHAGLMYFDGTNDEFHVVLLVHRSYCDVVFLDETVQ